MHRFSTEEDIGENGDKICEIVDGSGAVNYRTFLFVSGNTYTAELIIELNAVVDPK